MPLHEAVEHYVELVLPDARPLIGDAQPHGPILAGDTHGHHAAIGADGDGVVEQVHDDLLEPRGVGPHGDRLDLGDQLDPMLGGHGAQHGDDVPGEVANVEVLRLELEVVALGQRERPQVLDQPR